MSLLSTISAVVALGIVSLWVAWALRIPAIIILLGLGFISGPVAGLVRPDEIMGPLLQPFVSLAVALIMFEGGLSLKYGDIKSEKYVLICLLTIGVIFTWMASAVSAVIFTKTSWPLALLVGAILTVTGPTVVIPLLKHIRLTGKAGAILKWEGITIDPVGASLSVLVFEVIRTGGMDFTFSEISTAIIKTVAAGVIAGGLAACMLVYAMRKYWIPDFLQGVFTLMVVFGVFTACNTVQHESGLLGVTVMGILLANQKKVSVKHILEFKENLSLILISLLFILLSARLRIEDFKSLGTGAIFFVLSMIFIIRPASVYLSTLKSGLSKNEKLFLAFIAPRGIVAASVASVFALELTSEFYPGADRIASLVFLVIITTVFFYGFFSPFLARKLGLVNPNPQGLLIAGAWSFPKAIAAALQKEGYEAILVDTNMGNVTNARMAGLNAYVGSILSEYFMETIDLGNIKRILCLTQNDEMNALACQRFRDVFGSRETFQLSYAEGTRFEAVPMEQRGRIVFDSGLTFQKINEKWTTDNSFQIKITGITDDFSYESFIEKNKGHVIPMFIARKNGQLDVYAADMQMKALSGDKVISLYANPAV